MTVAELKQIIAELPDDTPVVMSDYDKWHVFQEVAQVYPKELKDSVLGWSSRFPEGSETKTCLVIEK